MDTQPQPQVTMIQPQVTQLQEAQAPPQTPAPVPVVAREHEIEEVMQFLRFSVKESSTFDGTILFKFRGDDGEQAFSYAVQVAEDRRTYSQCVCVCLYYQLCGGDEL